MVKNYELISLLMQHPAGYEVQFARTVLSEELEGKGSVAIEEQVGEVIVDTDAETITLIEE